MRRTQAFQQRQNVTWRKVLDLRVRAQTTGNLVDAIIVFDAAAAAVVSGRS